MDFRGQTVLVTGAGAGLGRAVALAFASAGANVTAVSLVGEELVALGEFANRAGLEVSTCAVDVGDPGQVEALAQRYLAEHHSLDVLVNNAGIIIVKPIEQTSVEDFDRVLATNLRGPFLLCKAFAGALRASRLGTIINVSSASGTRGFVGESAYCPSKFGLEGLTRTLALEFADSGVRAVSVTPGAPMRTPMSETTYDEAARKRWLDPELIAPGLLHLAAYEDDEISGGRFNAYQIARTGVVDDAFAEETA